MYAVTAQEMRELDRWTIEKIGIPSLVLMENAGRVIAEEAVRFAEGRGPENVGGRHAITKSKSGSSKDSGGKSRTRAFRWLVLVGKGHNGGDGIVCARHLIQMGYEAGLLYAVEPELLQGDAAIQRDIATRLGIASWVYASEAEGAAEPDWSQLDGIIDALLGTGSQGEPREPYASLIQAANDSGLPIISADIPSGIDADTGAARPGTAIQAAVTVALAYVKRGLLLHPGASRAGEVVVRHIGIPADAASHSGIRTYRLAPPVLAERFALEVPLRRDADSHKGTYGHVLVIAGSTAMSGAGLLCARAALRGGSGLVSWAVPEAMLERLTGQLPEAMLKGIPDKGSAKWEETALAALTEVAERKQALVVGPGLGRWEGDGEWLQGLLAAADLPVVVDADALNMLADRAAAAKASPWPKRSASVVVTPHPGEMARLCGVTIAEVQRDRIRIAREYAKRHGVIVVLKGAGTVVADPNGEAYVNTTGNPGMSTGGSGDVLAGIIGSLLGQGLEPLAAAAYGVYWHGLAGDRAAAARHSIGSLAAGDLIEAL